MSEKVSSWRVCGVIGLFLVTLLLRYLATLVDLPLRDEVLYTRELEAVIAGGAVAAGSILHNFPPLLFLLMTLAPKFGMEVYTFALWLVILISSLSPVAIYLVSRRLFVREEFAWMAGIIGAVLPVGVDVGSAVMRDAPYLCAVLWALWALLKATEARGALGALLRGALCGAMAGAAFSFRWEGALVAMALGGCCMLMRFRAGLRARMMAALGMLLAAAVVFFAVRWWYSAWGAPFWPDRSNTRINDILEGDPDA